MDFGDPGQTFGIGVGSPRPKFHRGLFGSGSNSPNTDPNPVAGLLAGLGEIGGHCHGVISSSEEEEGLGCSLLDIVVEQPKK